MKMRIKALLLAASLTMASMGTVYMAGEVESELTTETALAEDAANAGGAYAQYYDQLESSVASTLEQLSSMTDEQLTELIDSGSNWSITAAKWQSVKEELGSYVEVTDQVLLEEDNTITITSNVNYDGVSENTDVVVTATYDLKTQTSDMSWDVQYPMSTLMGQAGLNTLMGVGIVFLVLVFLSFLISQMHWIPDLMNKKEQEKAAAQAAPAAAAASAPVEEVVEEDLADDEELVAVIAAAIAAYEGTSPEGYVVRSIRKANRRSAL